MSADSTEPVVALELGAHVRRLPLVALAAALNLPRQRLRAVLVGLVLSCENDPPSAGSMAPTGEPTEGENVRPSEGNDVRSSVGTSPKLKSGTIVPNVPDGDGGRGEGAAPSVGPNAESLAKVLKDERNLPALRRLVAMCPPVVIQAALTETLAVPDHRIRKSRAAYFTSAVRRRMGPSGRGQPDS